MRKLAALALVVLFATVHAVAARAEDIRVMTSGALAAPFTDLAPEFERATGHKLIVISGASQGGAPDSIPERLGRGEVAHVVLLGREALDGLAARGLLVAGAARDIALSRIGMATRLGLPKPDISTPEALKKVLLEAPSVAYSASVSGTYLSTVAFQKLGVADVVLPKAKRVVSERVGAVLARGEADIGFQQLSELIPFAKSIQFVGPLPEGVQKASVFAAATTVKSPDAALSQRVIAFLSSRAADPVLRKYALDPIGAPREVQERAAAFAPHGVLRVVFNVGNPVLARQADAQSPASGVSVDLAAALAERLGLLVEPVVVATAGAAVETLRKAEVDIGFIAIDPARSDGIDFSPPYVTIEGAYAVPPASAIQALADVDRPGVRVAVGRNSAYDLFLTREIKSATLVRAPSSQAVVPMLLEQGLEVAANVRQQLEADIARNPGALRLLPGSFMTIRQAIGLAAGRGANASTYLEAFVEEMKASGFVAEALRRHGVEGASVAPRGR
jgi:polar amino acid transport system substrate-binding protein